MPIAGCPIMSFGRMQHTHAMRSCKSDLYALSAVAAECLYWGGLFSDVGKQSVRLLGASSVTLSVPSRQQDVRQSGMGCAPW